MTSSTQPNESFAELAELPWLAHTFIGRQAGVAGTLNREATLELLQAGFDDGIKAVGLNPSQLARAEQIHGGDVVEVAKAGMNSGVDGLITNVPGLALGIVVADCCAVYLVDPENRALGLVHSGKKGTEASIAITATKMMGEAYGSNPRKMIARLSPCIRPPAYEVDIAAQIRRQLVESGFDAESVFDDGACTARSLERYYSYRAEKGATGRMLAVLGVPG